MNAITVWRPQLDTIYHMDAFTLLRALPDASVDAVITDPPYGLTQLDFEQVIDWPAFWNECRRVARSKRTPVILFSQQPFTTDLIISNRAGYRCEIIWEKTMPVGFLNANRRPLQAHENILVFSDAQPDYTPVMETSNITRSTARKQPGTKHYNHHRGKDYVDDGQRYPRSVWRFAQRNTAFSQTTTLHPTQKPLACLERLVMLYTHPGAVVCDPFAGSGTTLVAAQHLGRRFVGCDISPEYVALACQRLAQPYTLPLFAQGELA